jgi:hypothetical protein
MRRSVIGVATFVAAALLVSAGLSQPPEPKGKKGGPPGQEKGPTGKKGGPPRFELGKLFPPHVCDELQLTPEQAKQLAELEQDVRARLEKILTADQKKQIEEMRPPGPPPGKKGPPPDRPDEPEPPIWE